MTPSSTSASSGFSFASGSASCLFGGPSDRKVDLLSAIKHYFLFNQDKNLLWDTVLAMGIGYRERYDLFSPYVLFFSNMMTIFPDNLNSFGF